MWELIAALFGGLTILVAGRRHVHVGSEWRTAARALGLNDEGGRTLRGTVGQTDVVVENEVVIDRAPTPTTVVRATRRSRHLKGLWIRPERADDVVQKQLGTVDIETGDPAFDELALIEADSEEVLGRLSSASRARLTAWLKRGGTIEDGYVMLNAGRRLTSSSELIQAARDAVQTAEIFYGGPDDLVAALVANAANDPKPPARRRHLEVAFAEGPRRQNVRTALAHALKDGDLRVRVGAALRLDTEGAETLLLAVGDSRLTTGDRVAALGHLLEHRAALSEDHRALLQRVLQAAVEDPIPALQAAGIPTLTSAEEPLLVDRLGSDNVPVAVAAAETLARVGTARAVEALLARGDGFLKDYRVKDATKKAVAAIQSRLHGADVGHLTLVDPAEEGALSLTPDEGALSLTGEDPPSGSVRAKPQRLEQEE